VDEIGVEYVFMGQATAWSWWENIIWGHYSLETLAEIIEKSKGNIPMFTAILALIIPHLLILP